MAKAPEEKVSYTCPECGKKYRVPESFSSVPRCAKCQRAVNESDRPKKGEEEERLKKEEERLKEEKHWLKLESEKAEKWAMSQELKEEEEEEQRAIEAPSFSRSVSTARSVSTGMFSSPKKRYEGYLKEEERLKKEEERSSDSLVRAHGWRLEQEQLKEKQPLKEDTGKAPVSALGSKPKPMSAALKNYDALATIRLFHQFIGVICLVAMVVCFLVAMNYVGENLEYALGLGLCSIVFFVQGILLLGIAQLIEVFTDIAGDCRRIAIASRETNMLLSNSFSPVESRPSTQHEDPLDDFVDT